MTGHTKRTTICIPVILTVCLACILTATGCQRALRIPKLGGIYRNSANYNGPDRNPVIVIPGILGSRLTDPVSGKVVWGAFSGDYANPETDDGARLLALPMKQGLPLEQLKDNVTPQGALDRLKVGIIGIPLSLNAYANILATLGAGGFQDQQLSEADAIDYGDDHFTCFQFSYDWRRDNVENAQRLHEYIQEKKDFVEAQYRQRFNIENPQVRFDLVAHSMGGLATRYFLRYGDADLPADGSKPDVTWAGARDVERVILIGPPNAGAIDGLMKLTHGVKFAPILPGVAPAILGTMPSIYQLLPRSRHGRVIDHHTNQPVEDLRDVKTWTRYGWGLANPNQADVLETLLPDIQDPDTRYQVALDHLDKCLTRASAFADAIDRPATPPPHLSLYLFAGDAVDTNARARVDPRSGSVWVDAHAPGDGTVLRSSALMDERTKESWTPRLQSPIDWDQVFFLFTDHLGITKDPAFSDTTLYLLLEAPRSSSDLISD